MTDELFYERLAIAVAQTGSVLPRIHGETVTNVNQLYPALISLVYGNGDVGASLASAHWLNAFLMASAAIPVYLLARYAGARAAREPVGRGARRGRALDRPRVVPAHGVGRLPRVLLGAPGDHLRDREAVEPGRRLAVAAIAVAFSSRTQLVILGPVFVLVVAADALLGGSVRRPTRRGDDPLGRRSRSGRPGSCC